MRHIRLLVVLAAFLAFPLFGDTAKTALFFTPDTTARTAPRAPVTTQTDNLRLEATVKWLGPSSRGSLIVYNGHGCCSGWGILLFASTDNPPNEIGVLAGGVTIVSSGLTLTPNTWQHVTMDRVGGVVTLTVASLGDDDDTPPQTASLGFIPVHFIGFLNAPAQTIVGDAFNGFVTDAKITSLVPTPSVIESWDFTHAPSTLGRLINLYGPTATGANGNVLNLTSSWAVPSHGNE